jgi:hypothetical protein
MSGDPTPMTLEGLNASLTAITNNFAILVRSMVRMACPSQHQSVPQPSAITHPPATTIPPLLPLTSSHRPIGVGAPAPTGLPLYLIYMSPSPSPIPSYTLSSMTAPEFTMATSPSPPSCLCRHISIAMTSSTGAWMASKHRRRSYRRQHIAS